MKNTLTVVVGLMFVGVMSGAQPITETKTDEPTKVVVSLSEDSQLVGVPLFQTIELNTGFGKASIPLAQVLTLGFAADKIKVGFVNKDTLSGTLEGVSFKVETSFGPVDLPYAKIKTMAFSRASDTIQNVDAPQVVPPDTIRKKVTDVRKDPYADLPEPPPGKVWLKIDYPRPQFQ